MKKSEGLKIAVVGAGVAGIVAAYLLQRKNSVTLYEKNDYIGGHTHTIVIREGEDAGTPVDTGFIVFNEKTYPNFIRFLSQLGVEKQKSSMTFSCFCRATKLCYGTDTINTFFSQRRNILNPLFWQMFFGILSFNRTTPRLLEKGALKGFTMGEYLKSHRYNRRFIEDYLLPVSAAVWSTPDVRMFDFPMETFARFFANHDLFSIERHPQWYTIVGGSHSYVKAFLREFQGTVWESRPVKSIRRTKEGVDVRTFDGAKETFDKVVIAAHADEALSLLEDPSDEEERLLSLWHYSKNRTVLHTDTTFLPPDPRVWSSWNYIRSYEAAWGSPVSLTYYMNRLQNLRTRRHYCVTLNTDREIPSEQVIKEMLYTHPLYTFDAFAGQDSLRELNGTGNTFFCGAYLGYGFHEDAVRSAVEIAEKFGIEL
ncbi:MAG: FAD-dependent oxidoreductase [Deltaproteobacteria bacterium]|nr:FAD-dependent oxidoreductase [Deltaproteobacteria bacterium]